MAQTEVEKELVLGNKQLISLFFVVVALCGVFFTMGYIIGSHATKMAVASGGDAASQAAGPTGGARRQQEVEPPRETGPEASAAPPTEPPAGPGVDTKPAQDTAPTSSAAPTPSAAAPELEAGEYLQVAALQQRSDADNLMRTLREKELPAVVSQNTKDGLFRVLVGPYRQTVQVAEAKEKLKTLGFANAFVLKQ
ncbi:MAG: SPOR domain-containing protein [Bryobacteraceae bacterium]|jgi:cell division septation protein DedD